MRNKRLALLLLSLSLVLLLVGSVIGCKELGLTDIGQSPQPSTPRTLKRTGEWAGTGIKTTETFSISQIPWAISWANNPEERESDEIPPGTLQIMVYDATDPATPISLVAHTTKQASDISYIHQAGTFYLVISGPYTEWTVQIWE